MPDVKFKINADGSGAKAALEGVKKEVKGLGGAAASLGSSLKGGLATFFGAAAITALTHQIIAFGDEIQNASDRLGIAAERIQSMRIAAKHAGYDLGVFDKIFVNMEKSFSGALSGGSQLDVLKKLGLSKDDVKHLNKSDALQKILEGTKNLNDTQARAQLTKIFGGKGSNALMAMRDDILDGNKDRILSSDTISKVDAFGDALEDLKDTVIISLIPALTSLVEWVHQTITGVRDFTAYGDKIRNASELAYFQKNGKVAPNDNSANRYLLQHDFLFAQLFGGEKRGKAMEMFAKKYVTNVFGADIWDQVSQDLKFASPYTDQLEKKRADRKKERQLRDAILNGPADRKPDDNNKFTDIVRNTLGNSDLIRIGGILGVDVQQRMYQLTIVSNGYLKRIADATEKTAENAQNGVQGDSEDWAG